MMQIHGLSPLQIEICDQLWRMQTSQEIVTWFDALPRSIKPTALAMIMMMNIQAIDEAEITDFTEANELINRIQAQ